MTDCEPDDDHNSELRIGPSLLLALAVGALFFYLATRAVPVDAVTDYLRGADWGQLAVASAAFVAVYAVCHGARVLRWYYLVRPLGDVEAGVVHRVCTVGFTAILLFPFRLGELVRPFLLARRTGDVAGAGALATVVVERVIDGLIITGLLFVGLWTYSGDASTELVRGAGTVAAAIFGPAIVLCIIAYHSRRRARHLVEATVGRLSTGLSDWIANLVVQFAQGFRAMTRRGDLIRFLAMTALYWGANVISMWLLVRIGFGIEVSPWQMVTVMSVLVVGLMVPAGPAMAGNFEYFMVQGMDLYVPVQSAGIGGAVGAYAALVHLLQIAVIVVPGVWVMIRHQGLRLSRRTLERSQQVGDDSAVFASTFDRASDGPN